MYSHATLQGAAKVGFRKFGVPPGGSFDPRTQQQVNAAVGNSPHSVVLELALCHFSATALADLELAWGGAPVDVIASGEETVARFITLAEGERITFEAPKTGARIWVAFSGGLVESTRDPLRVGDILSLAGPGQADRGKEPETGGLEFSPFNAIPGRAEFRNLFENSYTVRHDSNRVGIRLDGPRMKHQLELPSEPATPGVVQITPEGLPIILGPDGPTIGGYPRGAVVASSDLAKLAQLRPGEIVRFIPITP